MLSSTHIKAFFCPQRTRLPAYVKNAEFPDPHPRGNRGAFRKNKGRSQNSDSSLCFCGKRRDSLADGDRETLHFLHMQEGEYVEDRRMPLYAWKRARKGVLKKQINLKISINMTTCVKFIMV